jgi:hypothetical protein
LFSSGTAVTLLTLVSERADPLLDRCGKVVEPDPTGGDVAAVHGSVSEV